MSAAGRPSAGRDPRVSRRSTGSRLSMHVRPLTHRGTDGCVLTRPPEVEAQIVSTLGLDRQELRRRAAIVDQAHPDYLKDETVVYLLRESYRADDLDMGDVFAG